MRPKMEKGGCVNLGFVTLFFPPGARLPGLLDVLKRNRKSDLSGTEEDPVFHPELLYLLQAPLDGFYIGLEYIHT